MSSCNKIKIVHRIWWVLLVSVFLLNFQDLLKSKSPKGVFCYGSQRHIGSSALLRRSMSIPEITTIQEPLLNTKPSRDISISTLRNVPPLGPIRQDVPRIRREFGRTTDHSDLAGGGGGGDMSNTYSKQYHNLPHRRMVVDDHPLPTRSISKPHPAPPSGATSNKISTLQSTNYKPKLSDLPPRTHGECSICHDDITIKRRSLTPFTCNHRFHANCIHPWLGMSKHQNCPNCRVRLKPVK